MILYGGSDLFIEYNLYYFGFTFSLRLKCASKSWNCYQAIKQIIIHNNLKNSHNPKLNSAFYTLSLPCPADIILKTIISFGFEYNVHRFPT
jgi:hypothetical protein